MLYIYKKYIDTDAYTCEHACTDMDTNAYTCICTNKCWLKVYTDVQMHTRASTHAHIRTRFGENEVENLVVCKVI